MTDTHMPTKLQDFGWKAFFALLMLVQVIGVAVMWRTYDSITTIARTVQYNTVRIDEVILPTLHKHGDQIENLSKRIP